MKKGVKRGLSHIEVVLAFIIFIGAVGSILYFFNPASSAQLTGKTLTSLSADLIAQSSTELVSYVISFAKPQQEQGAASSCRESDGGEGDFFHGGWVSGTFGVINDKCTDESSAVLEYSCEPDDASGHQAFMAKETKHVCGGQGSCFFDNATGGAVCEPASSSPSSCTDSDESHKTNSFDQVWGFKGTVNINGFEHTDYCKDSKNLYEYLCDDSKTQYEIELHQCSDKCQNGACIGVGGEPKNDLKINLSADFPEGFLENKNFLATNYDSSKELPWDTSAISDKPGAKKGFLNVGRTEELGTPGNDNKILLYVYVSEDIDPSQTNHLDGASSSNTGYEILTSSARKVISEKKMRAIPDDANNLREKFNVPNNLNFEFELKFDSGRPENVRRSTSFISPGPRDEVFIETKRVEVLKEDGKLEFADLTLKTW